MKLRICHFVNHITGKSDGVYTHLMMLFRNLDRSKYEQCLVFQGNEKIENELKKLGIEVYVIPNLNKKFSVRCFIQFYKFIKVRQIDIIQTHFLKPYTIAGVVNIILRKKMIHNYQGLFINNLYNNWLEKLFYKTVHIIIYLFKSVNLAIAPSFTSKEDLLKETKLFPQIEVYYNGYDKDNTDELDMELVNFINKLRLSSHIVGIVARLEVQKRIDVSLEIAKIFFQNHKSVYFLYFGDGPLENEMKALADKMGINNNVKFMGYIPNIKYYIKYFDVLLFTSDWEGLPLTLWESMAAGVPIVSTDVGGIREIIEKEKCGLIFSKNALSEGAAAIEKVVLDKELKNRLGKNGLEAVKNKYNISSFIKSIEKIYDSIISE